MRGSPCVASPLLLLSASSPPPSAARDDPPPIDRVEEDWELVIRTTDVPAAGPQITTTMCPGPGRGPPRRQLQPELSRGRRPSGPAASRSRSSTARNSSAAMSARTESLQTDDETITWTQRLSISGGSVKYRVTVGPIDDLGRSSAATSWPSRSRRPSRPGCLLAGRLAEQVGRGLAVGPRRVDAADASAATTRATRSSRPTRPLTCIPSSRGHNPEEVAANHRRALSVQRKGTYVPFAGRLEGQYPEGDAWRMRVAASNRALGAGFAEGDPDQATRRAVGGTGAPPCPGCSRRCRRP